MYASFGYDTYVSILQEVHMYIYLSIPLPLPSPCLCPYLSLHVYIIITYCTVLHFELDSLYVHFLNLHSTAQVQYSISFIHFFFFIHFQLISSFLVLYPIPYFSKPNCSLPSSINGVTKFSAIIEIPIADG